jgi:hypothetical protein
MADKPETKDQLVAANRRLKGLTRKATEQIENLQGKLSKAGEKLNERDGVERAMLVSAAGGIAAGAVTAAVNRGVIAPLAKRWPWLAQRQAYAKGVPHIIIGYGVEAIELATRGRGPISTGREILSRAADNLGLLGVAQVIGTYWDRAAAQQAQLQAAAAQNQNRG